MTRRRICYKLEPERITNTVFKNSLFRFSRPSPVSLNKKTHPRKSVGGHFDPLEVMASTPKLKEKKKKRDPSEGYL